MQSTEIKAPAIGISAVALRALVVSKNSRMTDMHIYPLHDLVMAVSGGICGAAIAIAVMDVKRTIHASDKDRV